MNNNNQTAPVYDEGLDHMIWKLERDGGMAQKMLSLMRELRELRRNSPATPDGWVPCGERIPEEDLKVLANVKSTSVEYQCLAEIDKNGRWWDEHDEQLPSPFITHWMPLPAAPKEVG